MNVVFVTINDSIYLPGFFSHFLNHARREDNYRLLIVKPLYKNETTLSMALKYLKTFGFKEFLFFSLEMLFSKLKATVVPKIKREREHHAYTVKQVFENYSLEVLCVNGDVNQSDIIHILKQWDTELVVSVGSPQIFKAEFIHLPKYGCLNIHGSPLPRYRGVLPSFWMLKNKEKLAWNSIFFVNETIDGGDILMQESFPILPQDTLKSLITRSKLKASELLLSAIEKIRNQQFETKAIDVGAGTYFSWPTRKDVQEFWETGRQLR